MDPCGKESLQTPRGAEGRRHASGLAVGEAGRRRGESCAVEALRGRHGIGGRRLGLAITTRAENCMIPPANVSALSQEAISVSVERRPHAGSVARGAIGVSAINPLYMASRVVQVTPVTMAAILGSANIHETLFC